MSVLHVSGTFLSVEDEVTSVTDKILLLYNIHFSEESRFFKRKRRNKCNHLDISYHKHISFSKNE